MNKQELLKENKGLKLYECSSFQEMRNYKQNLKNHQNDGKDASHIMTIAEFNSEFSADLYYFESQHSLNLWSLEKLGFKDNILILGWFCVNFSNGKIFINEKETNIKTDSKLYDLIQLLK